MERKKIEFDQLIIKEFASDKTNSDFFDMNRNFSFYSYHLDETKKKYCLIIYNHLITEKKIKFVSPKIYLDKDNLKIKLYLQGFVAINFSKDFDNYFFELDFLNI